MTDGIKKDQIVVTDIRMPFGSMVVFMVKWALAAIPALAILIVIGAVFWSIIMGMMLSTCTGNRLLSGSSQLESPSATAPTESVPSSQEAEMKAYLPSVELLGIQVADSTTGGKGVFGEVKNNGDRTLSKVGITIYYLDRDSKPVFEKTYNPVLVTSFSFGDDNAPLKPGYSRKFGYRLDDAPSDWAGEVEVKVTAIKFAEANTGP
jgi:hypothetical protein